MKRLSATLLAAALAVAGPAHAEDAAPDHVFTEAPTDHATGAADAPNTLIIYASNMCPHCGAWFNTEWPRLKAELVETDRLRVVFRPLPSAPMEVSMMAFVMAECAPEGDYFSVIEDQFARQEAVLTKSRTGGLREEFGAMAKGAGLGDDAAIGECLNTVEHVDRIHQAGDRATAAGIRRIPAFILNGERLDGEQTAASLAATLKAP